MLSIYGFTNSIVEKCIVVRVGFHDTLYTQLSNERMFKAGYLRVFELLEVIYLGGYLHGVSKVKR